MNNYFVTLQTGYGYCKYLKRIKKYKHIYVRNVLLLAREELNRLCAKNL